MAKTYTWKTAKGAEIEAVITSGKITYTETINADGDLFAVNNNAAALFARCYIGERPQHADRFDRRKSLLDDLTPAQKWALVSAAREVTATPAAHTQPLFAPATPSRRWP